MNFKDLLVRSSGFFLLLIAWITLYALGAVSILVLPSPIAVFQELRLLFSDGEFTLSFFATLLRVLISFAIAAILGVALGLLLGYYKALQKAMEQVVDFWRSLPGIALFPLFMLIFGISDTSRIAVAVSVAAVVILINTQYGLQNARKLRQHFAELYRMRKISLFLRVLLPEASPYIFTGLRVALSLTLVIIIVTEMMLGTQHGLGQWLIRSQLEFETPMLYALILVLGILGLSLNLLFTTVEKKNFHWREIT